MHYPNTKLILYKVNQEELLKYLYLLDCRSYVSPTVNDFTVMYDVGFETHIECINDLPKDATYIFDSSIKWLDPSKREGYKENLESSYISAALQRKNLFDLTMLNQTASVVVNQYKGLPEGSLKCWAFHLSNHFSCVVLACYLRNSSDFWYHLSQNGEMLDEYATYAEKGWQPGQPIFSKTGTAIIGGHAAILCSALGQSDKVDEVEMILRKPNTVGKNHLTNKLEYESLLGSDRFSEEKLRHWALAKALGMHPWWAVWMSNEAIISEEDQEYCHDNELPPSSWAEIMAQLKSSQPISELQHAAKGNKKSEKPAIAYANQRSKRKGIEVFHPENILDDFRLAIQELARSSSPLFCDISVLLSEFVEINLNGFPLTESGKFAVIENLMTVAEALTHPENLEMRRIGLSALFELKRLLHSAFLSTSGQLWLDCEPILRLALEKDYS
jgi:hypothetical protein